MGVNQVGVVAWVKCCCEEGRTADPSAALGMTKGRVGFPWRIGCRDPRSQKRDLGHPSIVSDTD
jgi:hypothetical protein